MNNNRKKVLLIFSCFLIIFALGINVLSTWCFVKHAGSMGSVLSEKNAAAPYSNVTVVSDDSDLWNIAGSSEPSIAVDGNGTVHVVWRDETDGPWGGDSEILYANYTVVGGWSNVTAISDDGDLWNIGASYNPAIAVDGSGNLHVVWNDLTDGWWGIDLEIMYANYTVGGGWSNATVISDDGDLWNGGPSYSPAIAADGNGNLHVVWDDYTNGAWGSDVEIMYVNYTGSGSWSNATVISDDGSLWNNQDSRFSAIAAGGSGNLHVVWHDSTPGPWGGDVEIMYANHTATGGWSNATVISDDADVWNGGTSFYPALTLEGSGNVHVVWQDDTSGPWGGDREIMYANYTGSGSWSNATVISDDGDIWNGGDSLNPTVAVDGSGNVNVVWDDITSGAWGGGGTDAEILHANYTGTGSWSNATVISDDGDLWNGGTSAYPVIAIDGFGNPHVVWQDDTSSPPEWGTDQEIMYCMIEYDELPRSNVPGDFSTEINASINITWSLTDDRGPGLYRVWTNTSGTFQNITSWIPWINASSFEISVNTSNLGVFRYQIEFNDSSGQLGIPDEVLVTVKEASPPTPPLPPIPGFGIFFAIFGLLALLSCAVWIKRSHFYKKR